MPADRWERVQAAFHAAAEMPAEQRREWLERECSGDRSLVAEVMALLDADAAIDTVVDRGVAELAGRVLGVATSAGAATSAVGRRVGEYRLVGLLGEGGMGVVYRAVRDDIGAEAAIKLLRDGALSPARRERFMAEQRTLAQLRHPGIAQLYDAGVTADGTPWFAMELVAGATLTAHCAAGSLPLEERLRLFRAVAEAVQHAHAHAVIHRDLKPSNIMVTADGGIKLLDFGVAKQLDAGLETTATGMGMLTPAYAAPEQLGTAPVGVHTDVYSLGVVLYELLTGRVPFDLTGRAPAEALRVLLEEDPEAPSVAARFGMAAGAPAVRANPGQWADLDVLLRTAMHKEPARRYGTVDALLRDLTRFERGEPLEARADSTAYRLGKFARRNRRPLTIAAAAVSAIVMLTWAYTASLARARDAALVEAARTRTIQGFMLSLFSGGDDEVPAPDSLRVTALLDRGVREAAALDAEPAVQVELLGTLGGIYQQLGSFGRAESLLSAALDGQRRLGGSDDLARRMIALGLLRADQAEYDDAERLVREGLALARGSGGGSGAVVADAAEALGAVLVERGSYDTAAAVLDSAVAMRALSDSSGMGLARGLVQLASAHFYAGRYDRSDSLNLRALAIYRELRGPSHPLTAEVLINLGASRFQRGEYADAERLHREALSAADAWYGAGHYRTAAALTMVGRDLVMLERRAEATELLERARAIQERVNGPDHPSVASARNELGTVALGDGRLDEAEQHFRAMLDIYHRVHGDTHWLIGIAQSNLASVFVARGDYPAAERLYRDAVTQFSASQSPDHVNTGIARIKLGRALLRQRRWQEAATESEAGLRIVQREMDPEVSWAVAARSDLAEARAALTR